MNSGKLSPLLLTLMTVMAGILIGMAYFLFQEGASVLGSPLLLLSVGGVVVMAFIGIVMVSSTRRQLHEQAAQNERNQAAILQLLDELADLAEGDLTVHASVTENFTGAIADSINFAIDQMRGLVSNINHLSVQVAKAAGETQGTASDLATAAESQAKEIGAASTAINDMAVSIDQVSSNAAESSSASSRSDCLSIQVRDRKLEGN